MKIKMITIHNIANYGSVFQAMALNQYLQKQGHECEVIDYNPIYFIRGSLKSRIGRLMNYRAYKRRMTQYRNFVETNMNLTFRSYNSINDLRQEKWDADGFIAGGDQLWNEFYDCGKDDSYKLSFTNKPKIAFGTSLGKNHFTKTGMDHLKREINDYVGIGIREQSGVKLLQEAGLRQVHGVCDPVFLLDRADYEKFLRPVEIKEPYVFVYLVQKSKLLDEVVKFISEKLQLKVVLYAGFVPKCHCDIWIKEQGPEETLSYIVNADFVLSSSFHATAFSSLFHKEFLTILPGENTNARIDDFLELIGLDNRKISSCNNIEGVVNKKIEWAAVDEKLNKHIKQSKTYLKEQLSLLEKQIKDI